MNAEIGPDKLAVEALQPITAANYIAGFEAYRADPQRDQVLMPRQDVIFKDIEKFLHNGETEGYKGFVTAPTGTGKTVIIVETSKALLEAGKFAARTPKILVVEPTKNLVHQTLGRTGKKGYGKFAPDIQIASFFSESIAEDKLHLSKADVVVTTYDSLAIMTRRDEVRDQTDEEKDAQLQQIMEEIIKNHGPETAYLYQQLENLSFLMKGIGKIATGRKLIDFFDVFIFDEGHNIFGDTTATIVEGLGKDKIVLAFTASPDANENKRLENHLPVKIHDLTFKEASDLELVAPVASIGLRSHSRVSGSDLFNKDGDYQDEKLGYLAGSQSRNKLIANTAKTLVEHGFGTLIPCIAGGGAWHARVMADMLSGMGITAAAIHSGTPNREREKLLEQFEEGEIDVLTNIRVLREGYDSSRAKAIIEASLTRSMIIKRQRIGRILRPGDIAVVVDILDDYDRNNPPLHLPDILDGQDLGTGEVYGHATAEQHQRILALIEALGQSAVLADKTPAHYSTLFDTLSEYQPIVSGNVRTQQKGHYSVPERISPKYSGVNDEIVTKLWEMNSDTPDAVLGRQNFTIRALYNVGKTVQLLREVPECKKSEVYIEKNERWLSAEGFVIGFAKKFSDLSAALVEEHLQELSDRITWRPLKAPIPKAAPRQTSEAELYKAYQANKETIALLSKQLEDYFDITKKIRQNV